MVYNGCQQWAAFVVMAMLFNKGMAIVLQAAGGVYHTCDKGKLASGKGVDCHPGRSEPGSASGVVLDG